MGRDRMNRDQVAVATITLARSEDDERAILDALRRLALDRWPVAVSDGGSDAPFVAAVAALPAVTLVPPRTRGLVGQVKASVAAACALDTPFILYTEPDKFEFFDEHLTEFVAAAPDDPSIGVVLAARSPASFAAFPAVQRDTEGTFNRLCSGIIGEATDYLYGPFLMNRALAARVEAARDDLGWGWRPYVFAQAIRLGYRVESVVGDFANPPDSQLDDRAELMHRTRQLHQNLDGLLQALD
jgi:hypothetical protein